MRRLLVALVLVGAITACAGSGSDESASGVTPDAARQEPAETTGTTLAADDSTTPQSTAPLRSTDPGAPTVAPTTPSAAAGADEATSTTSAVVPVPAVTLPPVPGPTVVADIADEADFESGVSASILEVEAVDVEGRFPGERSGPGVVIAVQVENGSGDTISLDFTTVDLVGSDGASAIPVVMDDSVRLEGDLAPGASALGRYHFYLPVELRSSATITFSYAAGIPTALFTGALPDA